MRTIMKGFKILGKSYVRAFRIILGCALITCLAGCAARQKTVTNLPTGVTMTEAQRWDAAVANLDRIASFTTSARQTVVDLNKQGVFPDGSQYVATLQGLGKVAQLQLAGSTILKAAPGTFSESTKAQIQSLLQQISQQLTTLNTEGVTGIKNPSSQQQVTQLLGNITAAVTLILSL